ncbi:PDZ domain-containing protein [Pedobacter steynii]|uniref:PDZ domain-containing protein n=1 Tax=Pedobacter steynii TaxID=430522 RepID=A0A1G9ZHH7_9SPHI|nr:PDZ domain-containing protein [Pedobacter steynii]NQX40067.1 PDZ domain-containing protein [Pedobacter steynii]SDN20808.1 PDZ domain-containing protein [Pedobacter steynii]
MKRTTRPRITLLSCLLCLLLSSNSFAKELYISSKGNDKNPGSKEKPFATFKRAQMALRSIKGATTVYVRGGTYYLTAPVIFTNLDSRNSGEGVTYKSYPGEQVKVSGAKPLQLKWEAYKGLVKQAKVSGDLSFDQLFLNGKQQRMARYPNFNPDIRFFGGAAADAISPERVKGWSHPDGGFVHALHKHEWGGYQYLISGKDGEGKLTLEGGFQNNRQMGMHDKYRYVENIFEELDTAGEWYFNNREKILYFYPQQKTDLTKAIIEVPQLKSLFEFRGTEQQPVKNIQIEGMELSHTLRTFMETKEPLLRSDWTIYRGGAVVMEGAENCVVKSCFFNTVGGNGVFMSNYNRNNLVSGCHIAFAGASGVCFVGDPKAVRSPSFEYGQFVPLNEIDRVPGPKTNNYPANCTVENTLMYGLGSVEKQVAGVEISMAMDIKVSHNTIYDVPRAGINVSEGTWGGHLIAYNDVYNTVLESGDHGAFNSWGRDRYWHPDYAVMAGIAKDNPALITADVIKPIVIHDNRFRCDHGWDIDLDDGSSNYHIYNNVCLNGGLKLREGFFRTVENNVILNNSFHPHVWFNNSGDVFRHNIVTRNYFPIRVNDWGKEVDANLFPDQPALAAAQQAGTDAHSAFGDPGFVKATIGDYQVKPGSPALKLGFKNFPMNQFGVTSPSLKALVVPVKLPVLISEMKAGGQESYEFLGAKVKNLNTLGERSATGMATETGVLVLDVSKKSVLYGKLQPNDVILKFNDGAVKNMKDLMTIQMGLQLSQKATVEVFRNQASKKIEIALK